MNDLFDTALNEPAVKHSPIGKGGVSVSKHTLKKIATCTDENGHTVVVRWCTKCGAIVADLDIGGRMYPGRGVPMQAPIVHPNPAPNAAGEPECLP